MTHDSSTLGGNSGSAIIDVRTGEVIGLHFAGLYLRANYAVPTYELARDRRVAGLGVHFQGTVPADPRVEDVCRRLEPRSAPPPAVTLRPVEVLCSPSSVDGSALNLVFVNRSARRPTGNDQPHSMPGRIDTGFVCRASRILNPQRQEEFPLQPILVAFKPAQQIYWRGANKNPLTY